MHLINEEFERLIDNFYLTENVSLLIYSLIRTTRPLKVIEFGAGYSTFFIAKAFADIQKEEFDPKLNKNKWSFIKNKFPDIDENSYIAKISQWYKQNFIDSSEYTGLNYNPKLITIDNSANIGNNNYNFFNQILPTLEKLNLSQFVELVQCDWFEKIKTLDEHEKFDLVWIDIGSGLEYKQIFEIIFPKLNPAGMIAFHGVSNSLSYRYFLSEMKLKCKLSDSFEMISLCEPHKKNQNSIVIFKKNWDDLTAASVYHDH